MNFAAAGGQPRQQPAEDPSIGSETLFRRSRPPQVTSGYRRPSFICGNPSSRCRSLARLQCACADRYGKLTGRDRRGPCPIRDHRHHRVPTVDTLVAQHLITTIAAAKLMGADCICSGIRPQIAQIIVQLGLDLSVTSKATMADAFAMALRRVKGPSRIARILPSCNIRLRHVFPDAACGPRSEGPYPGCRCSHGARSNICPVRAASAAGHQSCLTKEKTDVRVALIASH
jgi:hypothetical protein